MKGQIQIQTHGLRVLIGLISFFPPKAEMYYSPSAFTGSPLGGEKCHMVHTPSVQVCSTSVWNPPAPVADSFSSESRSRPPWRWLWVWMKWCEPTVLWSNPRRPPLWSAVWTSQWLKTCLRPENTHNRAWNHKPVSKHLILKLDDI